VSRLDPAVDALAARAARLLHAGGAASIDAAIDLVCRGVPRAGVPSRNQVRRHLRGLSEEALGAEGYQQWRGEVLQIAAAVIEAVQQGLGAVPMRLCGRAARGWVDGDPRLHLRAFTKARIGAIAAVLVAAGFEEPQFDTLVCRVGRLDRLRFEHEGVEVDLVRCPPGQVRDEPRDLVSGAALPMLDEVELGRCVDRLAEGVDPF
jgi:hypothetical protein